MTKSVKLKQGISFTWAGAKYRKGVEVPVDNQTAEYLRGTGRFAVTESSVGYPSVASRKNEKSKKGKIIIKKPETNKVKSPAQSVEIPKIRSKKDFAEYAKKEHGFDFPEDVDGLKMSDMRDQLEAHIAKSFSEAKEPSIEV